MAHVRQQIRERVVTVLTGLNTTGNNIFETRIYPLQNTSLPALIVYTNSEESEPEVIGTNRLMSRNLSLTVECYVKQTSNPNDGVDTICEEVEKAIANDITLNGLAKDCYVSSTETEFNSEGEKPLLVTTLIFLINYYVKEQAPDVAV